MNTMHEKNRENRDTSEWVKYYRPQALTAASQLKTLLYR